MSAIEFNTTITNASGEATVAPRAVSSTNPLPVALSAAPSIEIGEVSLLGDDGNAVIGSKGDSAYAGSGSPSLMAVLKGVYGRLLAGVAAYAAPNGTNVQSSTTLASLLSDDFGGSAVSSGAGGTWDVINGGLPAIVSGTPVSLLAADPVPAFSQAKIGSGITGMTDGVAASQLSISMGTVLGAERWYLSQKVFAGKEDILLVLSKSQNLAANSIFVGLVEVDPVTFIPLLNANFAADGNGAGEFTNRGGCEFGLTTTANQFNAEAIGDSSAAKASGNAGAAISNLSTLQEYLIEIDSRDITVSNASIDSVSAKGTGGSRVSSQCPNDTRLYKLLIRLRNVSTPASNTIVAINRLLVVDNYEERVQISSAEGDQIGSKALSVNVINSPSLGTGGATIGQVELVPANTANSGSFAIHRLVSAATTNATLVTSSAHTIFGGSVLNVNAAARYLKFYNKASAPSVGSDTPVLTVPLPQNVPLNLADFFSAYGFRFSTGIAYAITGAYADSDTTAIGAGDVMLNLLYN